MTLLPLPQGQAVSQKIGARMYLECSARTGEGVREVFQHATRSALIKPKRKKGPCVIV
jgi:Ras family protein A